MKVLLIKSTLALFLSFAVLFSLTAQSVDVADSTGLPGDHFSLEGALELFKKSQSPEDFEKLLNQKNNYVNNLDLNEDGEVDYIRVIDHVEGEVHAMVLQTPVSENESQDIAVIEIEKDGEESAMLQIVGDEALYGEGAIIEPYEEAAMDGKGGPNPMEMQPVRLILNVWFWPSVRFVYAPGYRIWISPYRWRVYPKWWAPWRPHSWRWYRGRTLVYQTGFRVAPVHRVVRAHRIYSPRRTHSAIVVARTTPQRASGGKVYRKSTVTRTTVSKGNKSLTKTTRTTAVGAKGKRGAVVGKKSTTGVKARSNRGKVAGKKKTTTVKAKGKRGAVAGKKTTTVKKRKKN